MADLTIHKTKREANAVTPEDASAGGDAFTNNGKRLLYVENTGASQRTITFASQTEVDDGKLTVGDLAIDLPAGEKHPLGPFPVSIYNDGDGKVQMTYDDEADLKLLVLEVG